MELETKGILAHGFLPTADPLLKLPAEFKALEETATQLPKLLMSDDLRKFIAQLPVLPMAQLKTEAERERAMLLLSFLGHGYVWGQKPVIETLPSSLATPWYEVAVSLGRPPVLSYASYALHNWRRINPVLPIALGNIVLLQNFLGGIDEEWFVLVHIDIEAKAIAALQAVVATINAVEKNIPDDLVIALEKLMHALRAMCDTLDRMPEHCDPYIYYNRVRPYLHAWKDNPELPVGMIYEGVADYHNQPQKFRGETGAQSTIIPTMDAILGVTHKNDLLRIYLQEMREYMPPKHRQFLEMVEQRAQVREYVLKHAHAVPRLAEFYNQCIHLVTRFRQTHLSYAAQYIQKQSQTSTANPNAIGTGGTPFMDYLRKHKIETEEFLIKS